MCPDSILGNVARYYGDKLAEHGATAQGVDWKDAESQELRFAQLLKVVPGDEAFSINDYGCGYGALVDHLERRGDRFTYTGFDISTAMLEEARSAHRTGVFVGSDEELAPADYTVASGIFNVKLATDPAAWTEYVLATLERIDKVSSRGFAFNMLTAYADEDRKRPDLYYGDPAFFFDRCKRQYSRHVALLHDYGLYEFTILVRREPLQT